MSVVKYAPNMKGLASGRHTTVAASDNVVTGLRRVSGVICSFASDPVATSMFVTVAPANQITSPGVITIKTWMPTAAGNTIPIAAAGGGAFGKSINWVAFGE